MWIQLAGALVFAGLAIADATGLRASVFGAKWGPYILAFGCAAMLFEAWRTWRKLGKDNKEQTE